MDNKSIKNQTEMASSSYPPRSLSDEMGSIHFSQLSEQFDETIEEVISIGDTCSASTMFL